MKSPITYALMAGALALATATPAAFAAAGDDAATSTNYKAQLDKCKDATPTYQAPCKDAVGMREATPADKTAIATEETGSLQGRDKCARLSGDAQRDCLLNDKGG